MNNCNLISCRYNVLGECENEEKRKECVEVSKAVLCLEDNFIGIELEENYYNIAKERIEKAKGGVE